MINVLIGIFYIALIALVSYLLYFIIKVAIKDAYYELDYNESNDDINKLSKEDKVDE